MPGTAPMGSGVIDSLVTGLDQVRSALGAVSAIGDRQYRVYRVVRTWGGSGETGDPAGSTDVEVEITPTPIVRPSLRRRQEAQGVEEAGELVLEEVSLTYLHSELVPALTGAQELFYKLVDQHGQGNPARYFVLAAPPEADRVRTIGWVMRLRRAQS